MLHLGKMFIYKNNYPHQVLKQILMQVEKQNKKNQHEQQQQ